MTEIVEAIKSKVERLTKERAQIEQSLQFFRNNLEQSQIRMIQLNSQIDPLYAQ